MRPHPTPDPGTRRHVGATSLAALLWLHPDVALATWTSSPGRAIVDLLRIPEDRRRQGLGTLIYHAWEARLDDHIVVELFAVDACAKAFWSSLGFTDMGDGGMVKVVRPTRPPQDRSADHRDRACTQDVHGLLDADIIPPRSSWASGHAT